MNRIVALVLLLTSCASNPKDSDPPWTKQPTRVVDGGYIVYVGSDTQTTQERAQFRAEGLALEDLANECSMIPKGARLEDRYVRKEGREFTAYVKVALEFQECEQAKKAVNPEDIRQVANAAFTEKLRKYQELVETGEMPEPGELSEVTPPDEPPPPPSGDHSGPHVFVMRQYIAYQKEVVILAPPTAYPPGSPRTQKFMAAIEPTAQQVAGIEEKQPALRNQAWSKLPEHPHIERPHALAKTPGKSKPCAESMKPPHPDHPHMLAGRKAKRRRR